MTNRVTLTIHLDLPDGVIPDVSYGTPPVATIQTMDEPPLPDAPPPDLFQEAARIFPEAQVTASRPPTCKVHHKPMTYFPAGPIKSGPRAGQPRGAFYKCSEKIGDNWCTQRQDAA